MNTTKMYYRIDPKEISFLKFILEGYDNIGNITTINASAGIVVINIAPGCMEEIGEILNKLSKNIMIEPIKDNLDQYL